MFTMARDTDDKLIYSIGHSNHSFEFFLGLLKANGIETLVDVRSRPYFGYSPHFSQKGLKAAVEAEWIGYEFLGRELGGQPEGEQFYDENGRALYSKIAETRAFGEGLEHLLQESVKRRTAIMCAEEDPSRCHRRHLITNALVERGVKVAHIRGNGFVVFEATLREQEESEEATRQLGLFGDEYTA